MRPCGSRKPVNKVANPISLLHVRGDIAYRTHALARLLVLCRRNIETHRPFCFNAEDDAIWDSGIIIIDIGVGTGPAGPAAAGPIFSYNKHYYDELTDKA